MDIYYFFTPNNFYPRPPRGGRQRLFDGLSEPFDISIHALREEGDHPLKATSTLTQKFLSTPSARRATRDYVRARACQYISIHALREEGDPVDDAGELQDDISIHALREEGDSKNRDKISIFL